MRQITLTMTLAASLLAACEPVAPVAPPADEPAPDACGAAGYQGLIGQPREALASMNFPLNTRVIGPEDMVTADFRPDRLNIEYGRGGRIDTVSCY